jgi:hypothetical protein
MLVRIEVVEILLIHLKLLIAQIINQLADLLKLVLHALLKMHVDHIVYLIMLQLMHQSLHIVQVSQILLERPVDSQKMQIHVQLELVINSLLQHILLH